MITVRFPDGTAVTYNDANWLCYEGGTACLRAKEGGHSIAHIPAGTPCIIELEKPCIVENLVKGITPALSVDYLVTHIREVRGYLALKRLGDIKRALRKFNTRTGKWSK